MRILHTSDWHLGQSFMGKSRAAEHQAFLDWLLDIITVQQVDALIIAGDIFDTCTPPSYARELYFKFIVALQTTGCTLVVVGGNHDSVATLHESREVLACLNTHVIGGIGQAEQVHVLSRLDGEPGAILCAIPFLRPRDLVMSAAGESGADKQSALQQAITAHFHTIYADACAKRDALNLALPIIATGHLLTVGGSSSESVRDIYIGSLDAFPASGFPPADYIALGHLHKAQIVAGQHHIRYCGSPIPLSFDEAKYDKQVLLVDFAQGCLAQIQAIAIPCFQALACLKGSLAEITEQLLKLAANHETGCWVEVEVAGDDYLSDIQKRIQELTKETSIEVLRVRRLRQNYQASIINTAKETLTELHPDEVFSRRLAEETFDGEITSTQLHELFRQVMADIHDTSSHKQS